MDNSRRATFGRFGAHPVWVTRTLVANPITANTTNDYLLAAAPVACTLGKAVLTVNTVAADADGTILATLVKYSKTADAFTTLTSNLDMETMVTKEGTAFAFLATLTDAQQTLQAGDSIFLRIINNSAALNTQPTDVTTTVELFVKE